MRRTAAIDWIRGIVAEPEQGAIYNGKVVKVVDFGAFVNFLGAKDGLVHISELAQQRVGKVADVVKVGDAGQGQGAGLRRPRQGQAQHEAGRPGDRRGPRHRRAARSEPRCRPQSSERGAAMRPASSAACRRSSAIAARRRRRPENTLAGLRAAKALGCAWVEFDVRLTADGALVAVP